MKKFKILLVDDEAIILSGWKYSLESAGHYVKTALSGKQALEKAKEEKPDIVITDLIMPDMNGIEVCRNIKARYPDIDVILVSGSPKDVDRYLQDFLMAGGRDDYIIKPLAKEEIIRRIEEIME